MTKLSNEKNLQVYLKRVPEGLLGPDDVEIREAPIPTPGDGEMLLKARYVSLDAALRLITRDSKDFLFRVAPGDMLFNTSVSEVVTSNNPDFKPGDLVVGSIGAQNFGVSNGEGFEKVDESLAPAECWLGGFGVSGLTAYFSMLHDCNPRPGDTVLVNGAAGAVGTMAGQFAKLAGATVIGLTGSDEKCAWLKDVLGFDIAINYRKGDLAANIAKAAPQRLNFIYDNVGGSVLDASLRHIAMHGVVLLCGSTSQYTEEDMQGPKEYIWLGTMRARMQGFVVYDYAAEFPEARRRMSDWLKAGKLKMPNHVVEADLDQFGHAFQALYEGANKGKMLMKLP